MRQAPGLCSLSQQSGKDAPQKPGRFEYYDLHPTGYLLTPGKNYQIEFFAGVLEPMDGSAWDYEFDSDEEFEGWIQSAKEKSCFESDVNPEVTDKIVTLSTCTRESGYVRLVLYGRLK